MSAPALPYTTGATLPFGAGTLTPTTGNYVNTTYILESFDVTTPLTVVERQNANGGPNGAVAFQDAKTATGVIQMASTNAADMFPEIAAEFTRVVRGTTTTFFFTNFSDPEEIRGFKKSNFQAREKI
jgi:hypothetical protein